MNRNLRLLKKQTLRNFDFKNVFLQEKGMGESIVNSLRIEKLPRMRSCDPDRKFPRSIFIQFADRQSKDTGIKKH